MPLLLLFAISLVALPTTAFAVDMDYYVYGGHDAVVSSLNKLVLIFSSNDYAALFGMAFVIGVTFGGAAVYAKIVGGGNVNPLSWTPAIILGVAIYFGFIVPKGTLHVYDPVYNKYQPVGNLPDGLVILAGSLNGIERGIVELVTTAGDPIPFTGHAGGVGFLGLYTLTTNPLNAKESWIDNSLRRYVTDCVAFELTVPGTTLKVDELRKGSSSTPQTNFVTSLEKAANPAVDTIVYSSSDTMGTTVSCQDSWNNTVKTAITTAANIENIAKSGCSQIGYNPSVASELTQCKTVLSEALAGTNVATVTTDEFIRQVYISQKLDEVFRQGMTTASSNYQFLLSASGSMKSANEWLPFMRAGLIAITVGIIPFLALFIPTPLCGKAIGVMAGLFIWNTTWGITDAVVHQFAVDYANKAYEQIRQNTLGMDAIYFFPSQTIKLLGVFGTLRMSGMALATVITGMLVKFGGSAMSHMAGGLSSQVQGAGQTAALKTEDPGGAAAAIKGNVDAVPTKAWSNSFSFGDRTSAAAAPMFAGTASTNSAVTAAGGFSPYVKSAASNAIVGQHKQDGGNVSWDSGRSTGGRMQMSGTNMNKIQADHHNPTAFATTMNRLEAQAQDLGLSGDEAANMYFAGKTQDAMASNSIGGMKGFNLGSVSTPDGGHVLSAKSGQTSGAIDPKTGNFTNISGLNAGIKTSDTAQAAYSEKIADSRQQTAAHQQQLGSQILQSLSNSSTRSSVDTLANKSSVVKSGVHATTKAAEKGIAENIEKAATIKDSHGNEISKGSDAWSSVVAQAKFGISAFGTGGGVTGDLGGKMTVGIKTKDGHDYSVSFGDKETRSIHQKVGEAWSDSTTKSKGVEKSAADSSAVAEAQTITGTRNAQEMVTASEQRTQSLEQARTQSQTSSVDGSSNMDAAFVNFVGSRNFGGGLEGNLEAANYLNKMGAAGTAESQREMKGLMSEFIDSNALKPTGEGMPTVKGPTAQSPDYNGASADIAGGAGRLMAKQSQASHPTGAPASLREQISNFRQSQGTKGPNIKGTQRYFNQVKDNLSVAGKEWKDLNSDPMAPTEQFFGIKAVPTAENVSNGYVYQNPSFFEGMGDTASKSAGAFAKSALPVTNWSGSNGSSSGDAAGEMFRGNLGYSAPGGKSKPGSFTLLGR